LWAFAPQGHTVEKREWLSFRIMSLKGVLRESQVPFTGGPNNHNADLASSRLKLARTILARVSSDSLICIEFKGGLVFQLFVAHKSNIEILIIAA
jgi:hypothetical protein